MQVFGNLATGADWTAAMRRGDFTAAWRISDAVLATRDPATRDDPGLPYHLRWVWDGAPLDGRDVLVRCYHGLGDTIQFARYLAPLRARAARVTLEAPPELRALLAGCGRPGDPVRRRASAGARRGGGGDHGTGARAADGAGDVGGRDCGAGDHQQRGGCGLLAGRGLGSGAVGAVQQYADRVVRPASHPARSREEGSLHSLPAGEGRGEGRATPLLSLQRGPASVQATAAQRSSTRRTPTAASPEPPP